MQKRIMMFVFGGLLFFVVQGSAFAKPKIQQIVLNLSTWSIDKASISPKLTCDSCSNEGAACGSLEKGKVSSQGFVYNAFPVGASKSCFTTTFKLQGPGSEQGSGPCEVTFQQNCKGAKKISCSAKVQKISGCSVLTLQIKPKLEDPKPFVDTLLIY